MYLGGLRLDMERPETYRLQGDWLRMLPGGAIALPPADATRRDLV